MSSANVQTLLNRMKTDLQAAVVGGETCAARLAEWVNYYLSSSDAEQVVPDTLMMMFLGLCLPANVLPPIIYTR